MAKNAENSTINLAFMNIKGQTGLELSKQKQIEKFIQTYKIDILNCQEINIVEDSFSQCNTINSSFEIISNNASNKYGTCSFIRSDLSVTNLKLDTNGRAIIFDINNQTLETFIFILEMIKLAV